MRARPRRLFSVVILLAAAGVGTAALHRQAQGRGASAQPGAQAVAFDVDRLWPKPLPNHWILGSVTGVAVDALDHIWIAHRGQDSMTARTESSLMLTPPGAEDCCLPAPPVLEFDAAGALVGSWGGPGQGFDWPVSPGGITVDGSDNVWIAAAGPPDPPPAAAGVAPRAGGGGGGARGGAATPPRPADAHVLKFSRSGKFLLQIGKAGEPGANDSTTSLDRPAAVACDSTANEVYVADGGAHQRVVVFDATTGAFKRQWRVSETDISRSATMVSRGLAADAVLPFGRVSAIALSKDGKVYVGDRQNNRVVVFGKDGSSAGFGIVSKDTKGFGSVWGLALSPSDPQQRYVYVADGQDEKVFLLDRTRFSVVASFGDGGRWPGTFRAVTGVAADSKGNLYTGEGAEGKRVQRWVKKP
jgi:DNA-binding beta-propeller fold protein YncE